MNQNNLNSLAKKLIDEAGIPRDVVLNHLEQSRVKNKNFLRHLTDENIIPPAKLLDITSEAFGIPAIDLDSINSDFIPKLPIDDKLIRSTHALPILRRNGRIYLAVSDPSNTRVEREFSFSTNQTIEIVLVDDKKLDALIEKTLSNNESALGDLSDVNLDSLELEEDINDKEPEKVRPEDEAPIVRFVNKILMDAIQSGVSDIHIEMFEKELRIRYRRDGVLIDVGTYAVKLAPRIIARIKVMARMNIAERRLPQDGRIKLKLTSTRSIDFRVNTCPVLHGEKIVLRVLDSSNVKMGIESLGYEPDQQAHYEHALAQPHGLILVTGPTGSGKTVSLYTGLNKLNTSDRNISTAEDPAEINLPGINQVNVNPDIGLTFAEALKAFLRQDPDVIMVGEIRDTETAEIAIKAAQTGHLVLSTLHTNDAPQTLMRLANMGVPAFNIASSVSLIIAQRLARRLCPKCKKPDNIPPEVLLSEGFTEEQVATGFTPFTAGGCSYCVDGYRGRVGVYQVMPISEDMCELIMSGANSREIAQQAKNEGIRDLRQSGLLKVMDGTTSLAEISRVTKA